ncbi:endonuclease/exonuclease/phosphatase family protein [Solimonas soli]|uniref:endonuclease/exonuclease/phosphatase family protein n=1 Tax=Solimonas soli TaxID=413479 RepID=UPI000480D24F|nr:endonuclease/exonuclease/phosphatase family protein [Solimonas soli]
MTNPDSQPAGDGETKREARLRVLTLNIQVGMQTAHYGHYVTGAWRHVLPSRKVLGNLDRIAELASHFDVVALQEADAGSLRTAQLNQVEYLARKAGLAHWQVAVNRNLRPFAQHCLGFLSRLPLHEVEHHALPGRVPGRGALAATVTPPGHGAVRVVVAHLALSRSSRKRQLDYLADLVPRDRDLILLGDLNCELAELLTHPPLAAIGLQPVSGAPTFPSWKPQRRLDHVLATPGLRVAHSHVVPTPLSDHLAVAAELLLPPA